MRIVERLAQIPFQLPSSVLTLGNYDGVHLGHQTILEEVRIRAKRRQVPSALMTFEPHPIQILFPERKLKRLFPLSDLKERVAKCGLDVLVIEPFTKELAQLGPAEFLESVLVPAFHPSELVVGHDFSFGANRSGDLNFLKNWCTTNSVGLFVHPLVEIDGERVSSNLIRDLVARGEMQSVQKYLGRPFYLESKVEPGAGRGRQLQVPTMNMRLTDYVTPRAGVYVTTAHVGGASFRSVSNLGISPTFGQETELKLETHILNFSENVYGQTVRIEFLKFLREERKFPSVQALTEQIFSDISAAKHFARNP